MIDGKNRIDARLFNLKNMIASVFAHSLDQSRIRCQFFHGIGESGNGIFIAGRLDSDGTVIGCDGAYSLMMKTN